MAKSRKTKPLPSQVDVIKSTRRPLAPGGKVIKSKKDTPYRKRKHKGKIDY